VPTRLKFISAVLVLACVLAGLSFLIARHMHERAELPRFTKLDRFDPYRKTFDCKHQAEVVPPLPPEADRLFHQALALDSYELWPQERDYAQIARLYQQAAAMGHWKAEFNLAGLYFRGQGVEQNTEKATELIESVMKKGVPDAWDAMGSLYMNGIGSLKQDATVAWAFWQRAADMGSPNAQAYIGEHLNARITEPPRVWANEEIGRKMLECAFAQGSGKAALELGVSLKFDKDYERALQILQEGVKLGSADCAGYLSATFGLGDRLAPAGKDEWRRQRYTVLSDALEVNPDLRLPNLDKVLPLPPAELPYWNGDKQLLIDAAKAVVPMPATPASAPASAASQRTGRARIPAGFELPSQPQIQVGLRFESDPAPVAGYWLAHLLHPDPASHAHAAWNAAQAPLRFEHGEPLTAERTSLDDPRALLGFHYQGEPVATATSTPEADVRILRGIARAVVIPRPLRQVRGDRPAPATGIWLATVAADHPRARLFNDWQRQCYIDAGTRYPDPRERLLAGIEPGDITWHWCGQPNPIVGDRDAHIAASALSLSPPTT